MEKKGTDLKILFQHLPLNEEKCLSKGQVSKKIKSCHILEMKSNSISIVPCLIWFQIFSTKSSFRCIVQLKKFRSSNSEFRTRVLILDKCLLKYFLFYITFFVFLPEKKNKENKYKK